MILNVMLHWDYFSNWGESLLCNILPNYWPPYTERRLMWILCAQAAAALNQFPVINLSLPGHTITHHAKQLASILTLPVVFLRKTMPSAKRAFPVSSNSLSSATSPCFCSSVYFSTNLEFNMHEISQTVIKQGKQISTPFAQKNILRSLFIYLPLTCGFKVWFGQFKGLWTISISFIKFPEQLEKYISDWVWFGVKTNITTNKDLKT